MSDFFTPYRQKTPHSASLFRRAREVMPGGIAHIYHYFSPYPFFVKRGKGSKLWDVDGNEYIDLWIGNYTHILGHHPEIITEAVERQLKEGIHWGLVFEKQVEWAELIRELIPCAEMVRFCCSGTEATMYAVRVARAFTGRNTILKMAGGWHGPNADLTLGIKGPFEEQESLGLLPEIQHHTKTLFFNDIEKSLDVIRQHDRDLAGIIVEPVIGGGGFIPATTDYLRMLRSETEKCGALLIFDEVITGLRLSLGGAQARLGVTPDLATLGKIIGGGLPVGAVVGKKEILDRTSPERRTKKAERILIGGGTFSAHPLTVAAGVAMIRYLKDHADAVYSSLDARGKRIREGVQQALRQNGIRGATTGIGSLFQTHFPLQGHGVLNSPQALYQFTDIEKREQEFRIRMLIHGIHVMHGGGALSLAHSDADIERIVDATGQVAQELAQNEKVRSQELGVE